MGVGDDGRRAVLVMQLACRIERIYAFVSRGFVKAWWW